MKEENPGAKPHHNLSQYLLSLKAKVSPIEEAQQIQSNNLGTEPITFFPKCRLALFAKVSPHNMEEGIEKNPATLHFIFFQSSSFLFLTIIISANWHNTNHCSCFHTDEDTMYESEGNLGNIGRNSTWNLWG
jgi:hypothetical protein